MLEIESAFTSDVANPLIRLVVARGELHDLEGLRDDVPHRHSRAQRGIGILKDQLRAFTKRQHVLFGQPGHVKRPLAVVEEDLAAGDRRRVENGATQRRLTRPAFSHQAKELAPFNLEIDFVKCREPDPTCRTSPA